nr:NYN domain-containing protein [uncultured Anaeromusa sp.]
MECQPQSKLALFIDAENTKPDFEQLLSFCRSYGELRIARIYGYRDLLRHSRWQKECNHFQLEPVYANKGRKNSADMLLALDAVEFLYLKPEITTYIIASMDYDFLPLVHRLRKHQKITIGISTRYPPALLRSAFHEYHTLLRPEWDVFEFCAQQFYLAYLDCQVYDGWALADEVLFALPEPVPFLQRLHQMGFDSFFSFLKNCRFFSILKEKVTLEKSSVMSCWIRTPYKRATEPLPESTQRILHEYAQAHFMQNLHFVASGVPTLLRYFKSISANQVPES